MVLCVHIQAFTFSSQDHGRLSDKNISKHSHWRHSQDHGRLNGVHISKHSLFSWRRHSRDHGRLPAVRISKHSQKTLKITVGCPLCTYPSIHILITLKLSRDHGRLPAVHISKHSQQKLAHVRAVGTSTRAVACACAFTGDPQPHWFELTLLWHSEHCAEITLCYSMKTSLANDFAVVRLETREGPFYYRNISGEEFIFYYSFK